MTLYPGYHDVCNLQGLIFFPLKIRLLKFITNLHITVIHFDGCIITDCGNIPQFVHILLGQSALELFPGFCCYEHKELILFGDTFPKSSKSLK